MPKAKKAARKAAAPKREVRRRRPVPRKKSAAVDPLTAPVKGAERRNVGHVRLEIGRAGEARVKRLIYPPDSGGRRT